MTRYPHTEEAKADEAPEAIDTNEDQAAEEVAVKRGRKAKVIDDPQAAATFPVKLIRNYRPINDFTIGDHSPTEEERSKVMAGTCIELEVAEARAVIAKGIAVRNDPIN